MTALTTEGAPLFYLGAHQPHWLWNATFPLFVSHRQLTRKVGLRPAWPGHTHKNCANCLPWATAWRARLLDRVQDRLAKRAAHGEQGELFDVLDGNSNDAGKAA